MAPKWDSSDNGIWWPDGKTGNGVDSYIWTRKFEQRNAPGSSSNSSAPLVMLHGMGAGLALFCHNYPRLVTAATVYAIDLPGFGRSSRVPFSSDHQKAEEEYVAFINQWRINLGLERIHLLGHSFGGYLSAAYALRYPSVLEHIILVDPWGMPQQPAQVVPKRPFPIWVKAILAVMRHFNPLWGLRASGPAGPRIIHRMRPELLNKFASVVGAENLGVVSNYLFHCNAHNPTGETAFSRMVTGMAWAKNPMLPRLKDLHSEVSVTVVYGADSWVSQIPVETFTSLGLSRVQVQVIDNAGHHVYADQPDQFNTIVLNILQQQQEQQEQQQQQQQEQQQEQQQ